MQGKKMSAKAFVITVKKKKHDTETVTTESRM
jgi:hypothetical protein